MYAPLSQALLAFEDARDAYVKTAATGDREATLAAAGRAVAIADTVLTFLGYVEPYECGDCEACQANAAARREDMQAAVDADADLSELSPESEALIDGFIAGLLGTDKNDGETSK